MSCCARVRSITATRCTPAPSTATRCPAATSSTRAGPRGTGSRSSRCSIAGFPPTGRRRARGARAMEWIEANGASLRYELSGSGRDILVMVHEVGGCIESWGETLPAFQPHFRVLCYDQRGFGLSEKTRVITMNGIVDDLAALLGALGITGPVCLAGCAMGAAISLAFAGRHAGRVARVVAASPATWANADPAAARKRIEETER